MIQKDLAEIMRVSSRNFGSGIMISVTVVRVTPDMGLAKVYLSIFPSEKGPEILKVIRENKNSIRFDLGRKVGKQLRIIPDLNFFIDDSLDYAERIDELLGQ